VTEENNRQKFDRAFAALPVIAILRGAAPREIVAIGEALLKAGIFILEVPLNSPHPLESIERLKSALSERAVIGAGTVLTSTAVSEAAKAGAELIVSPNIEETVIEETKRLGLVSIPGVLTPSEALAGLAAGADILKLFPGEMLSPVAVKALAAVLPADTRLVLVGGVEPDTPVLYQGSPISGFGIGSALYKPGTDATAVGERARTFVAAVLRATPRVKSI
jgi:2-dehydro-3-deoxyphosphogalactonate aldolase